MADDTADRDAPDGSAHVSGHGPDPDYRYTLANERTYLAWLRTSLALLAGAVAVAQILDGTRLPGVRLALALLLVALSLLVAIGSLWRWRTSDGAIRAGRVLPVARLPWLVSTGVVVVGLLALVIVVAELGR